MTSNKSLGFKRLNAPNVRGKNVNYCFEFKKGIHLNTANVSVFFIW